MSSIIVTAEPMRQTRSDGPRHRARSDSLCAVAALETVRQGMGAR